MFFTKSMKFIIYFGVFITTLFFGIVGLGLSIPTENAIVGTLIIIGFLVIGLIVSVGIWSFVGTIVEISENLNLIAGFCEDTMSQNEEEDIRDEVSGGVNNAIADILPITNTNEWVCPNCYREGLTGDFCTACGTKRN